MNIIDLKRKSLGWVAREGDGGGGDGGGGDGGGGGWGGGGWGGGDGGGGGWGVGGWGGGDGGGGGWGVGDASASPGAVSAATAASSPSATSASEGGTSYGSFQGGYGNIGGWSSAGTGNDPGGPASPSGNYNPNASPSSTAPSESQLSSLAAASALGYGTDPSERSLMSRLGIIPGMPQDGFFSLESQVPGNVEGRLGLALSPVNAIGQIAMQANPAYGLFRGVADTVNNMDAGMSFGDAAWSAAKDKVAGIVAGKVNQAVGAAVGPGLGQYNKAASVANIFGAGMPSINPGGIVANAAFGKPSSPQATASNGGGLTSPDGSAVQGNSSGGWSSGSSGSVHKDLAPAMQVEDQKPAEVSTFTPKKFKDISYADWRKEN